MAGILAWLDAYSRIQNDLRNIAPDQPERTVHSPALKKRGVGYENLHPSGMREGSTRNTNYGRRHGLNVPFLRRVRSREAIVLHAVEQAAGGLFADAPQALHVVDRTIG